MEKDIIEIAMQFITTICFPIAMCLLIFYRMKEESNAHKEEVSNLRDVISENTTILAQLKQLIEDRMTRNA